MRLRDVGAERVRRHHCGELTWFPQDHRRGHAEGAGYQILERRGQCGCTPGTVKEHVPARDVRACLSVARVREQRPELRHRHLVASAEIDGAQQRNPSHL